MCCRLSRGDIIKKFESHGIRIHLWWVPADTDTPSIVAASDDEKMRDAALLVMGAGSHTDPQSQLSEL